MNITDRALELLRSSPPLEGDVDARPLEPAPSREAATARRWWFTFDGWRTADVEAEFVLA